jgi:hypothetical protein
MKSQSAFHLMAASVANGSFLSKMGDRAFKKIVPPKRSLP